MIDLKAQKVSQELENKNDRKKELELAGKSAPSMDTFIQEKMKKTQKLYTEKYLFQNYS